VGKREKKRLGRGLFRRDRRREGRREEDKKRKG